MRTESTGFFLPRFVHIFDENTPHVSRRRSRAGLLIAVILLPLLLSVLACIPVPVGDPEKSRIDPALSGVWLTDLDEDEPLMVFDPYDKRTWLVSWFHLEEKEPIAPEQKDGPNLDEENKVTENNATSKIGLLHKNQYAIEGFNFFKGWLTVIGGERFLTLEQKFFQPGVTPEYWWVFRVNTVGGDQLQLEAVNASKNGFEDAKSPEEAEKIIRQNLKNTDLYGDTLDYRKASQSELEMINQLIEGSVLDPEA